MGIALLAEALQQSSCLLDASLILHGADRLLCGDAHQQIYMLQATKPIQHGRNSIAALACKSSRLLACSCKLPCRMTIAGGCGSTCRKLHHSALDCKGVVQTVRPSLGNHSQQRPEARRLYQQATMFADRAEHALSMHFDHPLALPNSTRGADTGCLTLAKILRGVLHLRHSLSCCGEIHSTPLLPLLPIDSPAEELAQQQASLSAECFEAAARMYDMPPHWSSQSTITPV